MTMTVAGASAPAARPRVIPGDEKSAAGFVAWLRVRMSTGDIVQWSEELPPSFDTASLHHLPPPAPPGPVPMTGALAAWHANHRPGLCYYRQGPGLVVIKDIRDPATAQRIILNDRLYLRVFERCEQPVQLADLSGQEREAAGQLDQARLLLHLGAYVLTAPYRMIRWPISARQA